MPINPKHAADEPNQEKKDSVEETFKNVGDIKRGYGGGNASGPERSRPQHV